MRKKKCYHVERVERAPETQSEINTRESSSSPGRVTDYNPESVLADLSKTPKAIPGSVQLLEPCPRAAPSLGNGRMVAREVREQSPFAVHKMQRRLIWYKKQQRRAALPKLSDHHKRYLDDAGAFIQLPKITTDALLPIYLSTLDDLIPIMDGASIFRDYSNEQSSTHLVRAMCLVACKTKQAVPFLRLSDDGPVLGPLEFASKLLVGLDAALKADLEPDRVTKVRVLVLMHLNNDGVDRSSSYLSQAICEAWSMSLHWNISGNPDQDHHDYLWWTLRNFDRLNKPIMGASPFIIDDTDVSIDRIVPRINSYRSQLMAVATMLGDLMMTATKVYKASSTTTADDYEHFPSFDELASGIQLNGFHRSHRAYLEIWYHIAAMLSCRYSGPGTMHYSRRLVSADCVIAIISRHGHNGLPPLPLVPYAMSMATTVVYRALRDNERDVTSAYKDLLLCCNALDTLSQWWTSTKGVAKLAKRLWKFVKLDTLVGQPYNSSENSGSSMNAATVPSTATGNRIHEIASVENIIHPTIASLPTDQAFGEEQRLNHSPDNEVLHEDWPGVDTSCFHLDMAFQDLFDHEAFNMFKDSAAWNFVNTGLHEADA